MNGLFTELFPFSPDVSGFSSVIGGTDGVGLIDDTRGCLGNYFAYDEVREDCDTRVFVSEIGNEDVIMGTRPVLLRRYAAVCREKHPAFALLCSSPVSSVIGTDLPGIASEIAEGEGIPAAAVGLGGHGTYELGLSKTMEALVKLFPPEGERLPGTMNILGANYLDMKLEDVRALRFFVCEKSGYELNAVIGAETTSYELKNACRAGINWVVTVSGLRAAKLMKRRYGIPYFCGAPYGGASRSLLSGSALPPPAPVGERQVLIVGEQLASNALREVLVSRFGFKNVAAASFFETEPSLMAEGDVRLKSEDEYIELASAFPVVIADPLLLRCLPEGHGCIPLPHIPVSSMLFTDIQPRLLGENADRWLRGELSKIRR